MTKDNAIYKSVKCQISLNEYKDTVKDSNSYNIPVDPMPQIFYRPQDMTLKAGDFVRVERQFDGAVYSGMIGEPQWFQSHCQVFIRRDSNA